MSARDAILAATRAARPPAVPLPDVDAARGSFPRPDGDLAPRFLAVLQAGGTHVLEGARGDLATLLAGVGGGATRVRSAVAAFQGTVPSSADAAMLAGVELFVCEGALGVAENGAVWLPASRLGAGGDRAALFLAEHVAIVLDRSALVADMHAAYDRLDVTAEPFGVFVAGPSKTADIEQSLVIGAHGPKRLTLLLLGAPSE